MVKNFIQSKRTNNSQYQYHEVISLQEQQSRSCGVWKWKNSKTIKIHDNTYNCSPSQQNIMGVQLWDTLKHYWNNPAGKMSLDQDAKPYSEKAYN